MRGAAQLFGGYGALDREIFANCGGDQCRHWHPWAHAEVKQTFIGSGDAHPPLMAFAVELDLGDHTALSDVMHKARHGYFHRRIVNLESQLKPDRAGIWTYS